MLRSKDERDREKDRGGEAPMEIDSPPPLWLKSPASKLLFLFALIDFLTLLGPTVNSSFTNSPFSNQPIKTSSLNTPTPSHNDKNSAEDTVEMNCNSSPMDTVSSPLSMINLTPPPRSSSQRPHTSPLGVTGSGKSPLRSCHTNSDAVGHLRRLTTATFINSSPPQRSPTVVTCSIVF